MEAEAKRLLAAVLPVDQLVSDLKADELLAHIRKFGRVYSSAAEPQYVVISRVTI